MTIKAYQEAEQARLKRGHRSALHFSWFFAALGLIVWPGLFWVAGACLLMWLVLFIPDGLWPQRKPKELPPPALIPLNKAARHRREIEEWNHQFIVLLNETRRGK